MWGNQQCRFLLSCFYPYPLLGVFSARTLQVRGQSKAQVTAAEVHEAREPVPDGGAVDGLLALSRCRAWLPFVLFHDHSGSRK